MKIFAGKNWTERLINRWHARAALGALLRRADDRFLDDIGVEREDLRRAFGQWKDDAPERHDQVRWRDSASAPMAGSAAVLTVPTAFALCLPPHVPNGGPACPLR